MRLRTHSDHGSETCSHIFNEIDYARLSKASSVLVFQYIKKNKKEPNDELTKKHDTWKTIYIPTHIMVHLYVKVIGLHCRTL